MTFPCEFNIEEYGAKGNGSAVCTRAIQCACESAALCQGTVLVPRGKFVSGTIYLRSGITVRFSEGAILVASPRRSDFAEYETLATPSHADDETTYFAYSLFYGLDLSDLAIIGPGVIDGNRVARGGPKPLALKRCRRIKIQGITIENSPNYGLSLLGCTDARIESVTIRNGFVDGITVDSSRSISISNCHIQSVNDAICLKTSLALGCRQATENISVAHCVLTTSRSAFKIGSESAGSFKNIMVTQCEILSLASTLGELAEAGCMLQAIDGGWIENVFVSQIKMTRVRIPIFLRLGNRGRGQANPCPGELRHIIIRQIYASAADVAAVISGIQRAHIENVRIEDFNASLMGGRSMDPDATNVPEADAAYPRPTIFGTLPTYGFFCRHVDKLSVRNVHLKLEHPDGRPPVFSHDMKRTTVFNFDAIDAAGLRTVVHFQPDSPIAENRAPRAHKQTEAASEFESAQNPAAGQNEGLKETP